MQRGPGRPRINPQLRFPDIVQYFESVMEHGTPYRIFLHSKGNAVVLMHKMNRFRKAVRDLSEDGITIYDAWVFRVIENVVEVADKQYYTPFNTRVEVGGRDITEKLRERWLPLNAVGIPIDPHESPARYAQEYKRQFGVDPPSGGAAPKPPPPDERENNVTDGPLSLYEEDEEK